MLNLDFENVFSPIILNNECPNEYLKIVDKKLKDQKEFFMNNIHKKDLASMVFKKLGYGNLLDIEDNVITLNKILYNSNFIKLFKRSDIALQGICKIIFIYDKSSEYYLDSLKLRQKKDK